MGDHGYPIEAAVAAYVGGDETYVTVQVALIAKHFPANIWVFIWDAAREVGPRFCSHQGPPPVLLIVGTGNAVACKAEAKNHPGQRGVHHAEAIAGVEADNVAARGNGSAQRRFRNQVSLLLHIFAYSAHHVIML